MYEDVKNALMRKLRLGNYGQARDFLKRGNRYCALGLLIETYREETGRGRWDGPHEGKNGVRDAYCYLIGKNGHVQWSLGLGCTGWQGSGHHCVLPLNEQRFSTRIPSEPSKESSWQEPPTLPI